MQGNSGPVSSKVGSRSLVRCFARGERGHISYSCPHRRVNLAELEEEEEMLSEPTYEDYDDKEEDVDISPIQGDFGGTMSDEITESGGRLEAA